MGRTEGSYDNCVVGQFGKCSAELRVWLGCGVMRCVVELPAKAGRPVVGQLPLKE